MKILNKYFIYAAALVIAATAASCNNSGKKSDGKTEPAAETAKSPATDSAALAFDPEILEEEPVFVIKTDMGDIKIKLYKQTPLHRDNFVKLASERFYDGILFHRVIEGFMIQTGDPLTKNPEASAKYGTGGPGYNVAAEILPDFHHKKGAVAAARKGDTVNPQRESSGSQFYIVQGRTYRSGELDTLELIKNIPIRKKAIAKYYTPIRPEMLKIDRKGMFEALAAENVCCNVHYIPTYYFPYYQKLGYRKGLCPKAEKLYEEILSLPLYYAMSDQDVEDVIEAVRRICAYYAK